MCWGRQVTVTNEMFRIRTNVRVTRQEQGPDVGQ